MAYPTGVEIEGQGPIQREITQYIYRMFSISEKLSQIFRRTRHFARQ